jgi:rhamnosyltransferase subunit B
LLQHSLATMSRVVLTTLGSLGDLHPLIAIGLELCRRGHVVVFATSACYRDRLEPLGFGFHPMRPDLTPENPSAEKLVREIMDPRRGVERLLCQYILPELRATYEDLHRAVSNDGGAELLVSGELVYPAPMIAESKGIPWATCITTPMSFFSAYDLPVLPPFPRLGRLLRTCGPRVNRWTIRLVKSTTRSWSKPVRSLRAELGLPDGEDPIYEGKFSRQLVLAMFSNALAQAQPDWPPNTVITGFPFYDGNPEPLPPELSRFLDAGAPPIVFTLGSAAVLDPGRFYHESAAAAHRLNHRAVLLVGRNTLPAPLPEGVVAFGYVKFSQLFPRAAAIVHQGGIGTVGQALRAGRPMLVMPYNFDQPDNAARLIRLGVARTISRGNYSAERAARELKELLTDGRPARAAAEMGRRMQNQNGAASACDALEKLLLERRQKNGAVAMLSG